MPSLPSDAPPLAWHQLLDHTSEGLSGLGFLIHVLTMLGRTTAVISGHTVGRLRLPGGGIGSRAEPSGYLWSLHLPWL